MSKTHKIWKVWTRKRKKKNNLIFCLIAIPWDNYDNREKKISKKYTTHSSADSDEVGLL